MNKTLYELWKEEGAESDRLETECASLRAKLEAYEKLRPASEFKGELAIWHFKNNPRYLVTTAYCGQQPDCLGWTPFPDVKEQT